MFRSRYHVTIRRRRPLRSLADSQDPHFSHILLGIYNLADSLSVRYGSGLLLKSVLAPLRLPLTCSPFLTPTVRAEKFRFGTSTCNHIYILSPSVAL